MRTAWLCVSAAQLQGPWFICDLWMLCVVSVVQVLPVFLWISCRFSGFLPPQKPLLVGELPALNCP